MIKMPPHAISHLAVLPLALQLDSHCRLPLQDAEGVDSCPTRTIKGDFCEDSITVDPARHGHAISPLAIVFRAPSALKMSSAFRNFKRPPSVAPKRKRLELLKMELDAFFSHKKARVFFFPQDNNHPHRRK